MEHHCAAILPNYLRTLLSDALAHIHSVSRFVSLGGVHKNIEQSLRVLGSSSSFRMKLHRKEGHALVDDSLIGVVVGIAEQRQPTLRHLALINSEPVVLGSNEAMFRPHLDAGLVVSAIPVRKLVRRSPCREGQELVAKTDSKQRLHRHLSCPHALQHLLDVRDGHARHLWVTRPVADEETIPASVAHEVIVPGDYSDLRSSRAETAELVQLHSAVHHGDLDCCSSIVDLRLLARDLGNQIQLIGVCELDLVLVISIHDQLSQATAMLTQSLGQRSGINP
mmetsp:Transcript_10115/g.33698  ORF Transcript_10115/g.33698 Transcript_10115/m.33698 type:complete len:280 (-) Transcript_10115:547-1386(-)